MEGVADQESSVIRNPPHGESEEAQPPAVPQPSDPMQNPRASVDLNDIENEALSSEVIEKVAKINQVLEELNELDSHIAKAQRDLGKTNKDYTRVAWPLVRELSNMRKYLLGIHQNLWSDATNVFEF